MYVDKGRGSWLEVGVGSATRKIRSANGHSGKDRRITVGELIHMNGERKKGLLMSML